LAVAATWRLASWFLPTTHFVATFIDDYYSRYIKAMNFEQQAPLTFVKDKLTFRDAAPSFR